MKIALIGYGKMGKAIEQICLRKGHEVIIKINSGNSGEMTPANLMKADVAIEFTSPEFAVQNLKMCFESGLPVVCGTTGWLANFAEVKQLCTEYEGALVYASNFSIGVNLFFELNKKLARLMKEHPEYDVILEETHHTQKKDSPSGTAISLAEQVIEIIPGKKRWINAKSGNNEDLLIRSYRTDPAPGIHSIRYTSAVDDIEIIHTAHSREGFASGAVLAAEFIRDKRGIFGMKEVLGIG